MSNKTDRKIDNFEIEIILSYLNSNSKKIFNEIILAKKNNMWATIVVFSLTILDNIFHQDDTNNLVEGLELNKIKYSKDISWLMKKRNEILHYENSENYKPVRFLNDQDLKLDSYKAYNILCKKLIKIYKNPKI